MANHLHIFGKHDENTLTQLRDVASRAERAALMADGHYGHIMPVGGVVGYKNKVSVAGVGVDIGCGNAAIRTDKTLTELCGIHVSEIDANPYRLQSNKKMNELATNIRNTISFGVGRKNNADDAPVDDPLFIDDAWNIIPNTGPARAYRDELRDMARLQLGTIGSGNHYVDVLVDENDALWVGVHFGSRGLGAKIATNFAIRFLGGAWGDRGKPEVEALLPLDTWGLGTEYWELMQLAGKYAYAGREWVTRKVVSMFEGKELELVHNHHNFAWKEEHFGEELVVVRKGATPAFPGQKGFVGGSMGDDAVILQGTTEEDAAKLSNWHSDIEAMQASVMYSTVHGAGRTMSRTEAAGKVHRKTGRLIKEGKIKPADMQEWLAKRGVILRGAGLDESPQAYRRLPDVLSSQGDTVTVLHTLRPVCVSMADAKEFDPYKD